MKGTVIPIILISFILLSSVNLISYGISNDESEIIAFIVNSSIYPKIKVALSEIFENIDSYKFVIKEIKDQNPYQIRKWLQMEYEKHKLVGAVLIGDVPLAKYRNPLFNETIEFPYYYMDLDTTWDDKNGDKIINEPPKNYNPQIWIGIVRSTDMNGNNVTQINDYIHKVLSYINGEISVEPRSVAFVDDDFLPIVDKLKLSLSYPYVGFDIMDLNTTKKSFLNVLNENYPYGFIVAHSNGENYLIKHSENWENVYSWEISSRVLFYVDESCHGGDFEKGAIANYLIMGRHSQSLGVLTFTGIGEINSMDSFHIALGKGKSFGDALLYHIENLTHNTTDFNRYIAMLSYLGFPFLKPWRPSGYKEMPPLSIDGNQELIAYAKKYGWPGEGTEKDPIQITGIMIFNTHWRDGISIGNASLYVRIHHCYILVRYGNGISIGYSEHVEIENNTLYYAGIFVADSSNISISKNEIRWGFPYMSYSIDLLNVSNAEILGNRISMGFGIGVSGKFSYVQEGQNWSMVPHYVENVRVDSNVLINADRGITFYIVKNSKILRNVVNFESTGVRIIYSCNNSIEENNFTLHFTTTNYLYSPMLYVFLHNSCNNRIYLNNFFYSGDMPKYVNFHKFFSVVYFKLESSTINHWNNSKYGNYYQWWAEKNATNDRNNDSIVDYPWVIDENNTDYKPLKNPYKWWIKEERKEDFYPIIIGIAILVFIIALGLFIIRRRANF